MNDFVKKQGEYLFYSKSPELFGTEYIDIGIASNKINKAKKARMPIRIITREYGEYCINPLTQPPHRVRGLERGFKMKIHWYRFRLGTNIGQHEFDLL